MTHTDQWGLIDSRHQNLLSLSQFELVALADVYLVAVAHDVELPDHFRALCVCL